MDNKKKQNTNKRTNSSNKKTGTIADIINDLKEYAERHPEVITTTKRILDPKEGPVDVDHIPIHKTTQILDEIVIFKHGGLWSEKVTYVSDKMNFIVLVVDLEIQDKYGNKVIRSGTGASSLFSKGRVSRDSGDNAIKTAHSNALKKAAFFYQLGIQMWEKRTEEEIESTEDDIQNIKEQKLKKGSGKIITHKNDLNTIKSSGHLTEEQKDRIKSVLRKNNLTLEDAWGILEERINDVKDNHKWLLQGDKDEIEKKVNIFINTIEEYMKNGQNT